MKIKRKLSVKEGVRLMFDILLLLPAAVPAAAFVGKKTTRLTDLTCP